MAGFEPTRAEPIGFQVQRLNHSATTALFPCQSKKWLEMQGIEPWTLHMQSARSTTELHPHVILYNYFQSVQQFLRMSQFTSVSRNINQSVQFPVQLLNNISQKLLHNFNRTRIFTSIFCLRPYHVENTSSRLITEVKQHWAMLVLGWVTAWEYMVL